MAKKARDINAIEEEHPLYSSVGLFKVRLEHAMAHTSNRALADAVEMSEGAVRDYLRGNSVPDLDRMARIAEALNVRLAWLATGEGPVLEGSPSASSELEEFSFINNLSVEASAGNGAAVDKELVNEKMAFRKDWLQRHGLQANNLCFITARGDSMEPLIRSGDSLLVTVFFHSEGATDRKEIVHGLDPKSQAGFEGIFVLRTDDGLVVKRLQPDLKGGYAIKSDSDEYDDLHAQAEDLLIMGRVEWIGRRI